jgi:hypothetical protein
MASGYFWRRIAANSINFRDGMALEADGDELETKSEGNYLSTRFVQSP